MRWFIFLILTTCVFGEKYIVPEFKKGEKREIIITLKAKEKKYLVKDGDTLESIAKKFEMSIESLMRKNRFKDRRDLKSGTLILVDSRGKI